MSPLPLPLDVPFAPLLAPPFARPYRAAERDRDARFEPDRLIPGVGVEHRPKPREVVSDRWAQVTIAAPSLHQEVQC